MGPKVARSSSLNLPDLVSKYLNFQHYIRSASPQTLRAYQSDLCQAFEIDSKSFPQDVGNSELVPKHPVVLALRTASFPDQELLDVCRKALQGWVPLSPASRNRKASTLKSFLNWLHDNGVIERDLALQIHSPKVPSRLPHHLSVDEALALCKSLELDFQSADSAQQEAEAARNLALVLLLYGAGLRVSEACALTWTRVDLGEGVIRVLGKGGRERLIAIPRMVVSALKKLKGSDGSFVFGDAPLSTRKAYDIVRRAGTRTGLIQPLHPHALRHSYATHLLTSGANLRTLQELLGHRSLQATQRYTHIGVDQLARTMESHHPLGEDALSRNSQSTGQTKGKGQRG